MLRSQKLQVAVKQGLGLGYLVKNVLVLADQLSKGQAAELHTILGQDIIRSASHRISTV